MQVQIEELSPVEKKLAVEIPWERVREKLDQAFRELGKGAQLKGFRKGKVPRSVLERMFGKQVHLEVAKELVQESFVAAAQEHDLEPVAEPVVEDASIKPGEAFRYSARIEIRAPIDSFEWEGLAATRRPVVVNDEEIAHSLDHKRREHTEFRAIEGRTVSAPTDVLVIAVKGKVGDFPIDRPEVMVDLGDDHHEPLPGLVKALTGVPLDAKDLALALPIPEDDEHKEIAGKTAEITVSVNDAREKIMPALDDEFAKDTGEADTLDELRAKIREGLETSRRREIDREVRQAVLKELVARNPVPVAPALVDRAVEQQLQRLRYSMAMQGIDFEKAGVDLRQMRDRLRDGAADEVRGQLLLEALADAQKLEVTEAEVDGQIAELAAARDKTPAKLKAEMMRDGTIENVRFRLRQEKALDLVVSRATITEASPAEGAPAGDAPGGA